MRILLTGRNGQLGWELERSLQPLGEVIAVGRAECDLAKPAQVREVIRTARPDVIVNAAAYTAVDKAESEPELAQAINGDAPGLMAKEAKRLGALLLHYSTDYVFDGRKPTPYVETDATNPLSAYGRSKLAGEQGLAASECDFLCLRTAWVYAARGRNFMKTILMLAQDREELRVVCDQTGAPTVARLLADMTAQAIRSAVAERARGKFRSEVLHATSSGAISWHGFANTILIMAREMRPGTIRAQRVIPIATDDYPTAATRPLNSRLDCRRLGERYGLCLPTWEKGLRLCLGELTT